MNEWRMTRERKEKGRRREDIAARRVETQGSRCRCVLQYSGSVGGRTACVRGIGQRCCIGPLLSLLVLARLHFSQSPEEMQGVPPFFSSLHRCCFSRCRPARPCHIQTPAQPEHTVWTVLLSIGRGR